MGSVAVISLLYTETIHICNAMDHILFLYKLSNSKTCFRVINSTAQNV